MILRFRSKLMISYLLFILLISGSFYLYFKSGLQAAIIQESRANLISQAALVKLLVEQDKHLTLPQQLAERIGSSLKARVTLWRRMVKSLETLTSVKSGWVNCKITSTGLKYKQL